jgi:hypothetical protein
MLHNFESPLTRIFNITGIQKSDLDEVVLKKEFGEVDEAMFHGVYRY